ncbi:MAG: signal peptidase II [Oscillospiraceae bacterium]|nr:signal peptidase II [Oscillospiraceae bacterium]
MLYYILSILLIVIDQLVKWWVRSAIPLGQSIPFIPYVMDLAYVQNTGAAFSIFSQHTWILTLISLVGSVFLAVLLWKNFFPGWVGKLSLSLVLAGAVGNLIDRALMGYVTDMFQTTFIQFAVFNVADICVVVGGFLLVFYVLFLWDKDKEAVHDAP